MGLDFFLPLMCQHPEGYTAKVICVCNLYLFKSQPKYLCLATELVYCLENGVLFPERAGAFFFATRLCVGSWLVRSQLVSLEFFIDIKYLPSRYGPGVDSACNRYEYQEHFLGVKAADA